MPDPMRSGAGGDSRREELVGLRAGSGLQLALQPGAGQAPLALYRGGGRAVEQPVGGLGLGRYVRPDELEVIPELP